MKSYKYSDISLIPQFCRVISRSEVNTDVYFGSKKWNLPIVPANMSCSINFELAEQLEKKGYFYILHRFINYDEIYIWVSEMLTSKRTVSISLGIEERDYKFVEKLEQLVRTLRNIGLDTKIDYITIDIAHAHTKRVVDLINHIKAYLPETFVIAGNVSTPEAVAYLQLNSADAIKVGVGPGSACTTYLHTGFGSVGMFSTIQECVEVATVPIIADGGIKNNGDIVKALVAGADMVMAGNMFAQLSDSPAETVYEEWEENLNPDKNIIRNGMSTLVYYPPNWVTRKKPINKVYFGSASEHQKGENKHVEGIKIELKYNPMSYIDKLNEIKQDLQSAVSYAGGDSLKDLYQTPYKIIH